ncbi:MAG: hypothetical protein GY820_33265 [Gammaproteobacteria bacterium]|nr:hypothetical protein [Gammaproteobacteria bacterium]
MGWDRSGTFRRSRFAAAVLPQPVRREDGSPQTHFAARYGLPRATSPRGTVRRRDSSPQATLWHHGLRVAKKRPFSYAEFIWQRNGTMNRQEKIMLLGTSMN